MQNSTLLKGEKNYSFETIDQDGDVKTYNIGAFNLKEAKTYKNNIIGNSRSGEQTFGQIKKS